MTAQPITYLTPESFQKKYVGNPHWLIVGVTGHRDLRPQNEASIKELLTEKLDDLRKKHLNKKLLLCSALAPGADQWVAQCLTENDKLVVVKTLPDDELKKHTFEIQSPNDPALLAKKIAFLKSCSNKSRHLLFPLQGINQVQKILFKKIVYDTQ